jgi:site-specific DNA-cytosine methylase
LGHREAAKVHGLPDDFILPATYQKGMQIIGQGVLYRPFRKIAQSILSFMEGHKALIA